MKRSVQVLPLLATPSLKIEDASQCKSDAATSRKPRSAQGKHGVLGSDATGASALPAEDGQQKDTLSALQLMFSAVLHLLSCDHLSLLVNFSGRLVSCSCMSICRADVDMTHPLVKPLNPGTLLSYCS